MASECTCSALRMAARRLTQVYDAALASEGINTPQYALLSRLEGWQGDDPTVSQLAERLGLDRTTLARNLQPLERDGFVSVRADLEDRRARRVKLTSSGRAKRHTCFPFWQRAQAAFDQSFGGLRTADLMRELAAIAEFQPLPAPTRRRQDTHHAG